MDEKGGRRSRSCSGAARRSRPSRSPSRSTSSASVVRVTRAVILSGVRTPVGRYGGSLSHVRPDDLAAIAISAAVQRAGLRGWVAGVTLNRLCASGFSAVVPACHAVMAGDAEVVVAGGVESMSRAPLVMAKPEHAFPRGNQVVYDTTLGWRFPNPRMEEVFPLESMGETGENVAERYGVSREEQDAFALRSQQRWAQA